IAGRIDLVDFAIAVLVVRVVALLRHHLDGVRVDVWIAVRAVPLVRRKPVVIDVVVGPTGSAIDHPSAPRRRAAEVEAALPRSAAPGGGPAGDAVGGGAPALAEPGVGAGAGRAGGREGKKTPPLEAKEYRSHGFPSAPLRGGVAK